MSSSINPYNINGNYPVAGQDNDSQGFRDNFTNIRNNLNFAKTEIEDLQSKVLLKTALNGTTLTNDMAGSILKSPQLQGWTQTLVQYSNVTSVTVDPNYGNMQSIIPNGPLTLTIANWPSLAGTGPVGYGVVRLWFTISDVAYTVTLPTSVSVGVSDIPGYNAGTSRITFDATGTYVFDLSSSDGGTTFALTELTRNRTTLRGATTAVNGNLTVAGNLTTAGNTMTTISGNLKVTGGHIDNAYQYLGAPSTGFVQAIALNKTRLIIDPAATLATGTATLPANAVDGQVISIHSTAQITSFTANAVTGTVKPSAAFQLSAGTGAEYFYHASETTWYKIR